MPGRSRANGPTVQAPVGLGAIEHAIRLEPRAGGQPGVAHHAANPDDRAVTQAYVAFQDRAGLDQDVATGGNATANLNRIRVGHAHAGVHQFVAPAPLKRTLELGQLTHVVGAQGFFGIPAAHRVDPGAVARGNLDTVGQVVLALAVVVAQPTEPAGQAIGIGGQDPAVDFGDARLGLIRVTLFADAHDTALNVAQNAPVAVGIRGLETEYRQGRFEPGEFGQRCAAHQRHVARQHDHARRFGNSGHGLLHGMAGAQALVLGHRCNPVGLGEQASIASTWSAAWPTTTWTRRDAVRERGVSTCASMGLPAIGCSTLGRPEFIRLPSPAASTTRCRGLSVIALPFRCGNAPSIAGGKFASGRMQ